jgi:hypothetical protein
MGRGMCRKLIHSFQNLVVALLNGYLNTLPRPIPPTAQPHWKRRRVWVEADWNSHTPVRHDIRTPAPKRPQLQPLISTILLSLASPARSRN